MKNEFNVEFNGQTYPCFYIDNKHRAEAVIAQLLKKDSILAADLETAAAPKWAHLPEAALSPFLASPRLLQMFTGTGAVVIDLWKTGPINLKSLFEGRSSVFHNMTFDCKMLTQHYGIRKPDMHCTAIMARCVFHAVYDKPSVSAALKDVVKTLFNEDINKQAGKSDWSIEELTHEQIEYAAKDAILQMRVYEKLSEHIDKLGLRKVYDLYRKAQVVLCRMELNGLRLDKEMHTKNIVHWRSELMDAQDEVLRMTALKSITDAKMAQWLEETLPADVLAIWPRTQEGQGKLQTDANTFVEFSFLDIVKPFSRYQKLKKLTTSFGMNLLHQINPATGKLHPGYRVAGAKTGRLSCSEPNIQQMPRSPNKKEKAKGTPDIRAAFKPTDGYVLVVADYSQVEVRCIAEFSNDAVMLKAYQDGLDLYRYTAAHLNGIPYDQMDKEDPRRQQAKALVLGLNYGLGAKKFGHYAKKNYGVDLSEDESIGLVGDYKKLYSRLVEWQKQQGRVTQGRKYTAYTKLGKSRKMSEDNFYCACINHPIQGSCAEIMLLALVLIDKALEGTSARLVATVHDEVIVECLPHEVNKVKELLTLCMVKAYSIILPSGRTLKGLVEPSSGYSWAEAKH